MDVSKIWDNRKLIVEGILNTIHRKDYIEVAANQRMRICEECESFDRSGKGCEFPGTQPCCSNLNGGCGCSLTFKVRSMSSSCPKNNWEAILTQAEEDLLNEN